MKIKKSHPKCKGCGNWKVQIHCINVFVNGCDTYWCYLCWEDHAKEHEKEWDEMSSKDKDKLIFAFTRRK